MSPARAGENPAGAGVGPAGAGGDPADAGRADLPSGPETVRTEPVGQTFQQDIYPEVLSLLPEDRNVRILDAGAGEGYLCKLLSERGYQVEACDYVPENFLVADVLSTALISPSRSPARRLVRLRDFDRGARAPGESYTAHQGAAALSPNQADT